MPVPVDPSPKSHAYDAMLPSGSSEADASNVTGTPGFTRTGLAVKSATGGCGPGGAAWTTTSWETVPFNESLSVTFSVTLNVPGIAYGWVVIAPLPVVESPKSHA